MLNINIICIGRLKEKYLTDAVNEYSKRLKGFCTFSVIELNEEKGNDDPNAAQKEKILTEEGKRIIAKIKPGSYTIAMCIEGRELSSEELSKKLENTAFESSTVNFIIGGSYGLSDEVKNKADFRLSMGKMTFPHQLSRVMLCEQIYRALGISRNTKYHK